MKVLQIEGFVVKYYLFLKYVVISLQLLFLIIWVQEFKHLVIFVINEGDFTHLKMKL